MTQEEVIAIEGEPYSINDNALVYADLEVAGLPCATGLYFSDGKYL